MKADEAIEILKTWKITGDESHEALDMAIEALAKDINVPINDCISREAAIDALIEGFRRSPTVAIRAKDMIEQLPSAQPEPSQVARDIATIIENEKDMRVVLQKPQWVLCGDRMPEAEYPVIVTWKNNDPKSYYQYILGKHYVGVANYKNGKWFWYSSITEDVLMEYGRCDTEEFDEAIEVVAWAKLPEPYKEDTDE